MKTNLAPTAARLQTDLADDLPCPLESVIRIKGETGPSMAALSRFLRRYVETKYEDDLFQAYYTTRDACTEAGWQKIERQAESEGAADDELWARLILDRLKAFAKTQGIPLQEPRRRSRKPRRKTVENQMRAVFVRKPDSAGWSDQEWAEAIGRSRSAVAATPLYKSDTFKDQRMIRKAKQRAVNNLIYCDPSSF